MHYVPSTFYFLSIRVCQAIFSYHGNEEFNFEIMQKKPKCLSPKLSSVKMPMKYKDCLPPEISFDIHSFSYPRFDNSSFFYSWELPRNRLLIVSKRLSLGVYRTLLPTRTLRRYPKPSSLVPKNMPSLPPTEKKYQVWARKCEERARGSKNVPIQICQPFLNRLVMCIECAALSEIKHYSYIWPSHLQLCGRFERS